MRAILYKTDENGDVLTRVGTDPDRRRLTKNYKRYETMVRYGIEPTLKQWNKNVFAEVWVNWENRYKDPDFTIDFRGY